LRSSAARTRTAQSLSVNAVVNVSRAASGPYPDRAASAAALAPYVLSRSAYR
jgi:hypothetical protein